MPRPTFRIGLVFDNSLAYCRGVQRGINRFAQTRPRWTLVAIAPQPRELALLRSLRLDGLIAHAFHAALSKRLRALRKPLVNVATSMIGEPPAASVITDNEAVGRLAARHLLDRGFRHFGWIGHSCYYYAVRQEVGFRETIEAAGFAVSCYYDRTERSFHPRGRWWGLDRGVQRWLKSLPKPTGVLASSDTWGFQITEACRLVGLRIPEDLALVGVDDDDLLCNLARPPLSSVALPAEQVGYEAASLLGRLLAGARPPAEPKLFRPLGVVTRQSSDVLAVTDPDVAAAIRFIREHSHSPMRVSDVLRPIPVSRRLLERRFQQALGRGIWEEINRVRIERAKSLLDNTRLSVAEVAMQSGFTDHAHMCVVFQRDLGLSPTAYRREIHSHANDPTPPKDPTAA